MPVFLYHGLASTDKHKHFLNLVQKTPLQDSLILCSSNPAKDQLTKNLLQTQKSKVILGQGLLTFSEFFEFILNKTQNSKSLINFNKATLIYGDIKLKNAHPFPSLTEVQEELTLFQQIKTSAWTPSKRSDLFHYLNRKDLNSLFEQYQSQLNNLNLMDEADLIEQSLLTLDQGQVELPKAIFIKDAYPLQPCYRNALRLIAKHNPQIDIHIYYDEDFTQSHNPLSLAYEDLGTLAGTTQYFDKPTQSKAVYTFQNTTQELQACIQMAQKNPQLVFATNNSDFANWLETSLLQKKISCSNTLPHEFDTNNTYNWNFFEEKNPQQKIKNPLVSQSLNSWNQKEDLQHELTYTLSLLNESSHKTHLQNWAFEILKKSLVKPQNSTNGITIIPLNQLPFYANHSVVVTNLDLKTLSQSTDSPLFQRIIQKHPEWNEVIQSKSYKLSVTIQNLENRLSSSQQTLFTSSHINWQGSETIQLGKLVQTNLTVNSMQDISLEQAPSRSQNLDTCTKTTISVSAFQDYLKCPYIYYAKNKLSLEEPQETPLDPQPKDKGTILHNLLQNAVQNFLPNYNQNLNSEAAHQKLNSYFKEQEVILFEQDELSHLSDVVKKDFIKRAIQTARDIIQNDKTLYEDAKKQSEPQVLEWGFGLDSQDTLLSLHTKAGTLNVRGRIDRIDFDKVQNTYSLIDYKTGSSPTSADLLNFKNIQLTLYKMAFEKSHPQAQVNALQFYDLKDFKLKGICQKESGDQKATAGRSHRLTNDAWDDFFATQTLKITELAHNILSNKFEAKPLDDNQCLRCGFRRHCGRFEHG